jgi:hypothetical protein
VRHAIHVYTSPLEMWCECAPFDTWLFSGQAEVLLDELNRIAHQHIEAAEAGEPGALNIRLSDHLRRDLSDGYRVESAVISEDELIRWNRANPQGPDS